MTIKKSLIAVVFGAVVSTFFACCHLLDTLYGTANARLEEGAELLAEPGVVSALSSPIFLPAALILFAVIIFSCSATCSDYPVYNLEHKAPSAGVFGFLAAAAVGYTSVVGLIEVGKKAAEPVVEVGAEALEQSGGLPPILWQICMGLGIGSALAIAFISVGFFSGTNMLDRSPLLMLMPVLWLGMRLVLTFLEMTSSASISERSMEVVMLIFMTLFALSLGKFLANVGGGASRWATVYGGLAVMFALATAVSRIVFTYVGKKTLDGQLSQACTDIAESYGLTVNYGDLAMALFAVAMLYYISSVRQEEEDMAFGRRRRANDRDAYNPNQGQQAMYQQQMQQNMYQQNAMQQNMYQQQRQMQQNMYQQRQMQQAMYQQQRQMQQAMYQQRQMQQAMLQQQQRQMQQAMYQQMQPNPYQQIQNPQVITEPAPFGNNSTLPTDGISRQAAAQQRARGDRRTAQRGAGMRMADSFEVRTYGGPSINSRKKFGGLDTFRDQMLSGQSALNMQSEELPPPPAPTLKLDDEQAAMQAVLAASLEAEDVKNEINELTGQIEASVERIPEDHSGRNPADVQLEIPDDDAVISVLDDADDHSDEREYPSAPATRTVSLGSGKHQGTLSDHLAELEEYRRREAEQETYDDRYDSRYYDEGYEEEEYADGYEEYEDDYDYDEYEYDDEYDDGYDDGYGEEYEDEYDEYDDEYDEYDEYEDEYDDDDYYDDDDDGYYEE